MKWKMVTHGFGAPLLLIWKPGAGPWLLLQSPKAHSPTLLPDPLWVCRIWSPIIASYYFQGQIQGKCFLPSIQNLAGKYSSQVSSPGGTDESTECQVHSHAQEQINSTGDRIEERETQKTVLWLQGEKKCIRTCRNKPKSCLQKSWSDHAQIMNMWPDFEQDDCGRESIQP